MDRYKWRDKEEFGDKSDYVKGKALKSRLYFLGKPRELKNSDVYHHVCQECRRVFHKSQGLEFHMMDEHPYTEKKKPVNSKRKNAKVSDPSVPTQEAVLVIPEASASTPMSREPTPEISGQAQSSGRRSRRISGDQPDPALTQEDPSLTSAKRTRYRSASRDRRKSVMCKKYDIKECDVKLQTLKLAESPDTNNNAKDGRPDSVILETDPISSVGYLSLSSNNQSSQIKSWDPPVNNSDVADDEDLQRQAAAKDKVQRWLQMI